MNKKLILLLSLMLTACTSLTVKVPMGRFDTPEVLGQGGKFQGALGISETRDVVLSSEASARPPIINAPSVDRGTEIPFRAAIGIAERFEIIGRGSALFTSPWVLGGKFQFLGNPVATAKIYNFSGAVTAALGYESQKIGGDQNGIFGRGGYRWQANYAMSTADFGLIFGWRAQESILLYWGGYYVNYKLSGTIHDDLSDDRVSPEASYPLSADARNVGANAGAQFFFGKKAKAFAIVELDYSSFDWTNTSRRSDVLFGGLIGVNF